MQFSRYAIYYTPPKGPLADFGASWLGWDVAAGRATQRPDVPNLTQSLSEITATPRKYGFHGTIKPPFRLAGGMTQDALEGACLNLATTLRPVSLGGLSLSRLGGFLAFTVTGEASSLTDLAASVVEGVDEFRAPPDADELARRRKANLSPRQEALLQEWGYPYVMEEFRFHLTLTGRLPRSQAETLREVLLPHVAPLLPSPFIISDLTLVGEDALGMFHEIRRCPLSG